MTRILGAVLAGGRATRFGSDKALALLDGTTLLQHALDSLLPYCAALIVVGRAHAPVETTPDLPHANLGPLGGLAGAFAHADARGYDAVLTTACDTPALPARLVTMLIEHGCAHAAEAPTLGIWPIRLADPLLAHLTAGGDRSIRGWARHASVAVLGEGIVVPNINRPGDLRGA